jgi:hypothetical protein
MGEKDISLSPAHVQSEDLMRSKPVFAVSLVAAALSLALSGCGDKQESKPAATAAVRPPAAPAPAPAPAADPLGPRYEASMAEGIDFSKPGYPTFLAEVQGMSGREDWGRWTDGRLAPAARFKFKQPLPKTFTLVIKAGVFGPNLGKPVAVRVGGVEKTFVHKDNAKAETYRLSFELPGAADTVEIAPPEPTSPKEQNSANQDQRKLGVSIIRLQFDN